MRTRRAATLGVLTIGLGVLVPVAFQATPAYAYSINADDSSADVSSTVNGIPMKMRVLRPQTSGTFPLVVYLSGLGTTRCDNINGASSWLTRSYLAQQGYVVVSVNSRGGPGSAAVQSCSGGSQSTWNADVQDGLDDSGTDGNGPNDLQDISSLITWAVNGCNSTCSGAVDSNNIGIIGYGTDASRALLMPSFDSRVDAVVPVSFNEPVRNLKAISSDGAGTPAFRKTDHGYGALLWDLNQGQFGHADPSLMTSTTEMLRQNYLPNNNYSGYITSGTATLNITRAPYFSNADEGKVVSIAGAGGSATTTLWTTISDWVSSTQVTLSNNATSTVSSTNTRLVTWQPDVGSRNPTGGTTNQSTTLTLSSTSYPKFTSGDVGQPVTVAGGLSGGGTLRTTISSVTNDTTAVLATQATAGVSNAEVRWREAAWLDQRTVLDDDDAVDRAHHLSSTKVFAVAGFMDGTYGTLSSIELWNRIPSSNTDKYLYLGACGASPAPCGTNNGIWIRNKAVAFFEKYLKAVSGSLGGPIFYLVPNAATGTPPTVPTDNWGPSSNGTPRSYAPSGNAVAWPPADNVYTSTYCLDSDGNWKTYSGGSCTSLVGNSVNVSNRNDVVVSGTNFSDPRNAFCLSLQGYPVGYASDEVSSYTSGAAGGVGRIGKVELDVYASSDTSRLQIYADLYEVKSNGTEVRIWTGASQVVPVARNQQPGSTNKVHFKFQPAGNAWTIESGSKVRVKIATNNRNSFAPELIPSTTTLYHSSSNKMLLTIGWILS